MSTLQIWVRKSGVLQNLFILCEHGTNAIFRGAKIKIIINKIIGMRSTGISFKSVGRQMGYHYIVVRRLVTKHTQSNIVNDLPRSGRPHVTLQAEDRAVYHLVRRMPLATSLVLKRQWLTNIPLSARTVRNRLNSAGLKSRRVSKRPMLSDRHQRLRLAWCLARRGFCFL